jgi:hypothetical protein
MSVSYTPPAIIFSMRVDFEELSWQRYPTTVNRPTAHELCYWDVIAEYGPIVNAIVESVREFTPVFSGLLYQSIGYKGIKVVGENKIISWFPRSGGLGWEVYQFQTWISPIFAGMAPWHDYAMPVEVGSRAHRPPLDFFSPGGIPSWAYSHFAAEVGDPMRERGPWILGNHIAKRGHPQGANMFQQAYNIISGTISQYRGSSVPIDLSSVQTSLEFLPGEV